MKRANRVDVARLAGVSTTVVSYVVNNGPRPVAEATRERVLDAMRQLSYRPNANARALKLSRTNVIGLLVRDLTNPYFSELARDLQEYAHRAGYALMIGNAGHGGVEETAELQNLLSREVDGIAIYGVHRDETLQAITSSGARVVSLDWHFEKTPVPSVGVDDYGAARDAVQHLLDHGYSDIGLIAGRDEGDLREAAWADTLAPYVSPDRLDELRAYDDFSLRGGYRAAEKLLDSSHAPSAIFASSDVQALGAMRALHARGVRIPEEVAVISIDGTEASEFAVPSLSAIQLPLDEIAEYVARTLTSSDDAPSRHTFAHTLVRRESCGCVPSRAAGS
ncbi:LacI family DNA-binding transcriptional regulator [Microbacterium sp. 179-I 3D3 NHS]|uniref:LacI family DNA-binding transcriptional regulator n=1 Tax=Microbacterium sp. 179-I 3D3 NHS TaxID=3142382 RepID=UPI0039A16B6A